jgi:hypothetical protein
MKKLILLTGMLLMMMAKTAFATPLAPKNEAIERRSTPQIAEIIKKSITNQPTNDVVATKIETIDTVATSEIPATINKPTTNNVAPQLEPIKSMSTSEIRETIKQSTTYIFEGIKGRELTLSLWAGQLSAELYTPSGENMGVIDKRDNQWVGKLPESGIYRVRVVPKGETSSFVLERDFNAKWTYRPDRVIPIAFGETEGKIKLKMSGYQVQPLTVQGKRGQTMTVTASNKNVDVAIESPSGTLLDQGEGQTFAQLPESGVYRVLVVANRPIKPSIKVSLQ